MSNCVRIHSTPAPAKEDPGNRPSVWHSIMDNMHLLYSVFCTPNPMQINPGNMAIAPIRVSIRPKSYPNPGQSGTHDKQNHGRTRRGTSDCLYEYVGLGKVWLVLHMQGRARVCRHRMLRQRVDKYARIRVKLQGLRRLTTHDSCGSFSGGPVRRSAPSLYCNQPAPRGTLLKGREGHHALQDGLRCRHEGWTHP